MAMAAAARQQAVERRRTLAAVTASAPSRAEWVGWRTVARMISRGRKWIYAMCRHGSFEARQIPGPGRRGYVWRVRRESVEEWLERFGRAP
jgi:hypothetical protein